MLLLAPFGRSAAIKLGCRGGASKMKTILISCLQLSKRTKTSKHLSEAERVELKDACQRESLCTDQEKMGIFH